MTRTFLMPDFSVLMMSSSLRQAQAIQVISQGNISQGLTILQQEINFNKRILRSNGVFIDKMVAFRLLLTQYHTVEVLLDHPALKKHLTDAALTALLTPLTKGEQQGMARALEGELYFLVTYLQVFPINSVESIFFNRTQTINKTFLMTQSFINHAKITLPEAQYTYQELVNYQAPQALCEGGRLFCLIGVYKGYGLNLFGWMFLETEKVSYKKFIFRLYGLQSYLALINAKLLIKQQAITKLEVPAFLHRLGDKVKNLYTQGIFKWNEATSTLSTESISKDIAYFSNCKDIGRVNVSMLFN